MIAPPRVVERVTRTAPFGFRAWDPVARRSISDLVVTARDRTGRARPVVAGRGDVFSIRGLPIASAFVAGSGGRRVLGAPPDLGLDWVIEVADPAGRYLPFRFLAAGALADRAGRRGGVPDPAARGAGGRRRRRPAADAAPAVVRGPACPAPAGAATVTMDLRTTSGLDPAGTIVEVSIPDGPTGYGLADRRGVRPGRRSLPGPGRRHRDAADATPTGAVRPGLDRRGVRAFATPTSSTRRHRTCAMCSPRSAPRPFPSSRPSPRRAQSRRRRSSSGDRSSCARPGCRSRCSTPAPRRTPEEDRCLSNLAPGVFVEEVSFRSKSIEGVSTTTHGVRGPDPVRPDRRRARHPDQPRRVRADLRRRAAAVVRRGRRGRRRGGDSPPWTGPRHPTTCGRPRGRSSTTAAPACT